jgi:L-asparagine transporter-like permease
VIGLTVPYTNPNLLSEEESAVASPFVIALELAGVKSLASVINAVILLSTYSASTSYLYAASRTIVGCDVTLMNDFATELTLSSSSTDLPSTAKRLRFSPESTSEEFPTSQSPSPHSSAASHT